MLTNYDNVKPGYKFSCGMEDYTVLYVDYHAHKFIASFEQDDINFLAVFDITFMTIAPDLVDLVFLRQGTFTLCDILHHHFFHPVAGLSPERN